MRQLNFQNIISADFSMTHEGALIDNMQTIQAVFMQYRLLKYFVQAKNYLTSKLL